MYVDGVQQRTSRWSFLVDQTILDQLGGETKHHCFVEKSKGQFA
jgi:hypothetical protein